MSKPQDTSGINRDSFGTQHTFPEAGSRMGRCCQHIVNLFGYNFACLKCAPIRKTKRVTRK